MEQYDNALKCKIKKEENKADFATFNSSFPMQTNCHLKKQLQEAYTNENFKLFQDELRGMIYYNFTFIRSEDARSIFQVTDILKGKDGRVIRQVGFNVCQNKLEFDIKCPYPLFEFR